nr:response regulator [Aromatoleum diolicum]
MLVDDQRAILAGVTALIACESPHMQVTGQARCGREALELAHDIQPDIIVLDADLAGEDGIALIPLLQAKCQAAIVVFTCLTEPDARHRALRLGAADFVPKTSSGSDLIAAILGAME